MVSRGSATEIRGTRQRFDARETHTTRSRPRNHTEIGREHRSPPRRRRFFSDSDDSEREHSDGEHYSDSDFDNTDEDEESEFTFAAPHRGAFELPTTHAVPESSGVDEPGSKTDSSIIEQKSLDIAQIVSSKYILTSENGSDALSGELMRVSGRVPSLFSWLHLNPEIMDFNEFSKIATSLPNSSRAENDDIFQFLQWVGGKYQKPIRTATGRNGWYMEPTVATRPRDKARFPAVDGVSVGHEDYMFCCLPYFRLESQNSVAFLEGRRLHPSQPLFQSYYPSIGRQRDLQQVICHLQGVPKNHCFHVSTLWCLIIPDKYIITCTKSLLIEDILADSITIRHSPAPDPLLTGFSALSPTLQMEYDTQMYLLPIDQCDTWFKFIRQLSGITLNLEEEFLIRWRGHILEPSKWPRLISQAKKTPTRIQFVKRKREKLADTEKGIITALNRQLGSSPGPASDRLSDISEDTNRSRSRGDSPEAMSMSPTDPKEKSKDRLHSKEPLPSFRQPFPPPQRTANPPFKPKEFHALLWLAVSPTNDSRETARKEDPEQLKRVHRERIESYLTKLHEYMETNENTKVRIDYQKATEKRLEEVDRVLAGFKKSNFDTEQIQSLQMRFASVAESVFQIFMPKDWRSNISSRYWGAVIDILTAVSPKKPDRFLRRTLRTLEEISGLGKQIRFQLSAGKGPDPTQTNIPREFVRAWYHLLLCMLFWSPRDMQAAFNQARSCRKFLLSAQRKILKRPEGARLIDLEVLLPTGLLAFLAQALIKDVTHQSPNTRDAYWEYYHELEISARANPLDRSHQKKVSAFIDEIRIIKHHINSQQEFIQNLQDRLSSNRIRQLEEDQEDLVPEDFVSENCRSALYEKGSSFDELLNKSESLIRDSKESIQENKDRQETAIFIFTIVTVIFLPLSTVSSYLGMNTSDIRDMQSKQWVFWAAAIPLTVVILFLARLWAFPGWTLSSLRTNFSSSRRPHDNIKAREYIFDSSSESSRPRR